MSTFMSAVTFLIQTIFDLYLIIVILRLVLQFFEVDYYNPLSQFVVKVTNPLVLLLRRVLPRVSFIDISALVLFLLIDLIKFILLISLTGFTMVGPLSLLVLVIADLIRQTLNLFFYVVLISVVLSWVSSYRSHPMMDALYKITEPLLAPVRRVIPPIAGFDISPIVVLIGLKLLSIILVTPLVALIR